MIRRRVEMRQVMIDDRDLIKQSNSPRTATSSLSDNRRSQFNRAFGRSTCCHVICAKIKLNLN